MACGMRNAHVKCLGFLFVQPLPFYSLTLNRMVDIEIQSIDLPSLHENKCLDTLYLTGMVNPM